MKNVLVAMSWLCLLIILLIASLAIAIAGSWPTYAGFIIFIGLLLLLLTIRITIKLLPGIINKLQRMALFQRHGSNRLERLLWRHWWHGGRLQSWRRFVAWWQHRGALPPWFLITGPEQSGKRSLLNDSHLSLLPEKTRVSAAERFATCRWRFFRNAIYLLIAGRYTDGSSQYRQAWLKLTHWIGKVRPPAGVVVCLPMEMLLTADEKALYAAARNMRTQLQPLHLRLGYRLPVWIMVTGAEALPGLEQWCLNLPPETRRELLGSFIDQKMDNDVVSALEQSLFNVTEALQIARLKMHSQRRTPPDYAQLALPERFAELRSALCCYGQALFECDRYQQHGLLCGVFFSASITFEGQTQPENTFSERLMEEYLPAMAQRYQPVRLPSHRSLVKGLLWGATAVLVTCLLLNGGLNTYQATVNIDNIYAPQPQEQRYLRYQQMESWKQNAYWSSVMFYPVTRLLQKRVAASYLYQTDTPLFQPADPVISQLRQRFSTADENQKRALILNWARFINTEQAMARGASLTTLQALPAWSPDVLTGTKTSLPAEQNVALRLAAWRLGEANQDLALWRSVLKTMLEHSDNWQWLLTDDEIAPASTLTLADFWPLSAEQASKVDARISGKYTAQGHQQLAEIMEELDEALGESAWFATQRKHFLSRYQQQQQLAWLTFSQAMPEGENRVQGKKQWQAMILSTSNYNSPYLKFLRSMMNTLSAVSEENQQPWLHTQRKLWQMQSYIHKSNIMKRVSLGNISLRQSVLSFLGISPQISVRLNDNALSRYQAWRQAVDTTGQQVLASDQEAEQMVKAALGTQSEAGNSNQLNILFNRFSQWRNAAQDKQYQSASEILWRLWQGDGRLILRYALINTASQLQSQWKTSVIWPIETLQSNNLVDEKERNARLYEYINGFVRDKAAFALQIQPEGIRLRESEGILFPLYDSFIIYLNGLVNPDGLLSSTPQIRRRLLEKQSILKDEQTQNDMPTLQEPEIWAEALLTSLPVTANAGAKVLPTGSTFTLQCQDNVQQFSAINFKDSKMIKWNPQSCGAVQVDVRFPTFTLSKRFDGADGLLKFMRAFSRNELMLPATAFPEHLDLLNSLNINKIIVRYQIGGREQAAALYQQWQDREQQQSQLHRQSAEIDTQLLNLSEPDVARGSFTNLPQDITAGWNQ